MILKERMTTMKVIMYGAEICPDCVAAKEQLKDHSNIELDYRNITENTSTLKEFLSYRDHDEIFAPVKEAGRIGIPFFILEDGTRTLELSDFIEISNITSGNQASACSLDGKGQC
jgi:glutaredoxin-related protein